jgi:hypothetical protein
MAFMFYFLKVEQKNIAVGAGNALHYSSGFITGPAPHVDNMEHKVDCNDLLFMLDKKQLNLRRF